MLGETQLTRAASFWPSMSSSVKISTKLSNALEYINEYVLFVVESKGEDKQAEFRWNRDSLTY